MALGPGSRIGPYEITALLGEGGMGKVWRARHTALKRDDALKVVPDAFSTDPGRLARFQREAEVLASLNHSNIAHVYGLEDANGVKALVMELVEGPTLADRIAQGAIPLDEALPIAYQIADALDAAHERGVIHRDLKPANVKIRPDGGVKVLDFGLAKAMEPAGSSPVASESPTLTTPAMVTGVGVILGTAAYMSPEQARGRAVDKRADIWAFGCVLYEMLTGKRAFEGDDVTVTLARVVEREPDFDGLPTPVPGRVRQVLRLCLRKDPRQRASDIRDVRLALEGAFETAVPQAVTLVGVPQWRRVAVVGATALLTGVILAGGATWLAVRPPASRVTRTAITPPAAAELTINGFDRDLAITPDGSRIVYVGANGTQLFVRALDALEPVAIATASPPRGPFVSPDGQWIGFNDGGALKKLAITGGPAVTLADFAGAPRGATWAPDGTIIFATANAATGLQRVSAAGGTPEVLTRPDRARGEIDHLWPELLPSGRAVLFTTVQTGGLDAAQVVVLDLETGTQTVLVRGGTHAHYVSSGHLIYGAGGTLWAVAFDLNRLETRGTPVPVINQVVGTEGGGVDAVMAGDGTLAYVSGPGGARGPQRTLVWVSREGHETAIPAPPRAYVYPRIAPDGASVILDSNDQERDIWRWDFARSALARLTFDGALDTFPAWTADGRRLVFSSDRAGARNLFWQAADGTGAVERLTESPNNQSAVAVSPDGTRLIFTEIAPQTGNDVMQVHLDDTRRVTPLVQTPFFERNGIISPDGRWLAYEANDSGEFEVYVRPFPDVHGGRWQVSTGGGTRPLWAPNGQELFYVSPTGALLRVGVERGPSWVATTPTPLIKGGDYVINILGGNPGRTYDISPDGRRFLLIKVGSGAEQAAAPVSLIIVQNFDDELKRLVPTN